LHVFLITEEGEIFKSFGEDDADVKLVITQISPKEEALITPNTAPFINQYFDISSTVIIYGKKGAKLIIQLSCNRI